MVGHSIQFVEMGGLRLSAPLPRPVRVLCIKGPSSWVLVDVLAQGVQLSLIADDRVVEIALPETAARRAAHFFYPFGGLIFIAGGVYGYMKMALKEQRSIKGMAVSTESRVTVLETEFKTTLKYMREEQKEIRSDIKTLLSRR